MKEQTEVFPVKVGHGKKVHAGYLMHTDIRRMAGREVEIKKFSQICGSGRNTCGTRRNMSVRELPSGTEINCPKCLKAMKAYGRNYKQA